MTTDPEKQKPPEEIPTKGEAPRGQTTGTAEILQSTTTVTTAVALTGRRQAFRDIRRQLAEDELQSPGVQKLLLEELERSDADCDSLRGYVEQFHEADKRAAVLEERLKSNRATEVMFAVGLTIGGACIGWAPAIWDTSSRGPIALGIGIVLLVGSIIAKVLKG